MMRHIRENTILLTPDPPAQRCCPAPRKSSATGATKAAIREMVKEVMASREIREEIFLLKQLRRANEFQAALAKMGCKKGNGTLPGWYCPPGAHKVMLKR